MLKLKKIAIEVFRQETYNFNLNRLGSLNWKLFFRFVSFPESFSWLLLFRDLSMDRVLENACPSIIDLSFVA